MKLARVSLCLALVSTLCDNAGAITLDAAMAKTLEKNVTIQQARLGLEQAAGRRLVLRATALPDVRINVVGGDQGGHRAGEKSNQPFGFARGFFVQPVFNAAIPAAYRRGNLELIIAEQQLNVAIVGQLHALRIAFDTALYNDALRALGEAQRDRIAHNIATQTDRYQVGTADRAAVIAARLLENELNPRIEDSRRAYAGALLTLAETMGENLSGDLRYAAPEGALAIASTDFDLNAETSSALARRADLKLARLLVRAAEENQRMIEAAYYPSISATISGDYIPIAGLRRGSEGSPRRSDDIISSELRAGGSYTWRVVDNGKIGGQVARQRAVREVNELLLRKLEANVPRELATIDNQLRSIRARRKALGTAAQAAEQNVTAVQENLVQGLSSQLEFRTAETSFLQSKSAALTAAYEQNVALAEWDRATGRYFQFSGDTPGKSH